MKISTQGTRAALQAVDAGEVFTCLGRTWMKVSVVYLDHGSRNAVDLETGELTNFADGTLVDYHPDARLSLTGE